MLNVFISVAGRTAGDQTWKLMMTGLVANAERWAVAVATKSGRDIDLTLQHSAVPLLLLRQERHDELPDKHLIAMDFCDFMSELQLHCSRLLTSCKTEQLLLETGCQVLALLLGGVLFQAAIHHFKSSNCTRALIVWEGISLQLPHILPEPGEGRLSQQQSGGVKLPNAAQRLHLAQLCAGCLQGQMAALYRKVFSGTSRLKVSMHGQVV